MGKFLRLFGLIVFSPALAFGVVHFLAVAGFLDLLASAFGDNAGVTDVIKWLANPPLLLLSVLALYTLVVLIWKLHEYTEGQQKKFIEEWGKLDDSRQVLRDLVPPAYATWAGGSPSFADFSRFVEIVMFPNNLPLQSGKIRDYAKQVKATASGDPKQLLDFCTAIYPQNGESSLLNSSDRKQLYKARMQLSKFWNSWAKECFKYGSIKESEIMSFPQVWELTLLAYLEIPLAIRNNDRTNGKQWLFQLTQKMKQSVTILTEHHP